MINKELEASDIIDIINKESSDMFGESFVAKFRNSIENEEGVSLEELISTAIMLNNSLIGIVCRARWSEFSEPVNDIDTLDNRVNEKIASLLSKGKTIVFKKNGKRI